MMKIKIPTDFDFAHRGIEICKYRAGEEVETDDDELVDFVRSLSKKTPRKATSAVSAAPDSGASAVSAAPDAGTSTAPESEASAAADLAG